MWATLLVAPLALQLPSSPDAPIGRRAALVGLSSYAVAALASPASAKKLDSDEVVGSRVPTQTRARAMAVPFDAAVVQKLFYRRYTIGLRV